MRCPQIILILYRSFRRPRRHDVCVIRETPVEMHSPASITSRPARSGADFLLSVMYQTGYLVPKDMNRAWSLCKRAATKGDTHAQMTLKTIIERSDRSNPFFQSSLEWFVKSDQCAVPEGWHHAAVVLATEETEDNVDQTCFSTNVLLGLVIYLPSIILLSI